MLHHYTFPCQLTTDPCYTITPPLPIDHRSMLHHYTSLPIDHRSMLHHYTFPCQLTTDPCYTITPPLPIGHTSMQNCYTPQFSIVIVFNCQFATDCLHTIQMLIFYHHHFHLQLSSLCN